MGSNEADDNFIHLRGRDLRPPNHEVVPARRVFRHAGIDVKRDFLEVVLGNLLDCDLLIGGVIVVRRG